MKDVFNIIFGFIEHKSARLGVSAFVLSALVTAACTSLVGIEYRDSKWIFAVPNQFKIGLLILFIVLFVASWFILHLLNSKDKDDVYSEVREKLAGEWIVTYSENMGLISGKSVVPSRNIRCTIAVDQDAKLELIFHIKDNPLYEDKIQIISDVAIRRKDHNNYNVLYYYKDTLVVNSEISKYILPEPGMNKSKEIEIELFGHITFSRPALNSIVTIMEGRWFDLNGNPSRLFSLLDQRIASEFKGEPFNGMTLSQVPIHQKHFDADMGPVRFERGAK